MILQLGVLGGAILLTPLQLGLQAQLGRTRFPRLGVGSLGRAIQILRTLRSTGREGRVTSDPVTGNLVVFAEDQPEALQRELIETRTTQQFTQQAIQEILAEDPLFFVRLLPPGDPRRLAVGLNGPEPPERTTIRREALSPAMTVSRTRTIVPGPAPSLFRRRAPTGRFAVR